MKQHPIITACNMLGGQARMAKALGITGPAIGQWVTGLRQVPLERCVQIQRMTSGAVTMDDMRPDMAEVFAAVRQVRKR